MTFGEYAIASSEMDYCRCFLLDSDDSGDANGNGRRQVNAERITKKVGEGEADAGAEGDGSAANAEWGDDDDGNDV